MDDACLIAMLIPYGQLHSPV